MALSKRRKALDRCRDNWMPEEVGWAHLLKLRELSTSMLRLWAGLVAGFPRGEDALRNHLKSGTKLTNEVEYLRDIRRSEIPAFD
jgi:hypothetical protein